MALTKSSYSMITGAPVNALDYGVTGNGVTDDGAAMQLAVTAAGGKSLLIPPGSYNMGSTALSVPAGTSISAYGATLTWTIHVTGVSFVGSTFKQSNWFGGKLVGAKNASYNASGIAMSCVGTAGSPPTNVYGPKIKDVELNGWGAIGFYAQYCNRAEITNSRLLSIGYAGVLFMSSINSIADYNYISDISPGTSGNAYGVTFTRDYGSLTQYPRSTGSACHNVITNIPVWKAMDTHGGENILFNDNYIYDCETGISITTSKTASVYDVSPQKVIAENNTVIYSSNNGAAKCGIELTGGYDSGTTYSYSSDCIIANNVIYGCGQDNNVNLGSLRIYATKNVKVVNNVIENSWGAGIQLTIENLGMDVSGNTVIDVFDNTNANVNMLWVNSSNQTGRISDNVFVYTGSGAATYKSKLSIEVANTTGLDLDIGPQTFVGIDATHLNMALGTTAGVNTSMVMRQRGSASLSGGAATITFAKRFPLTPTVMVTNSSATNGIRAYNPSQTGANVAGTGTDTFIWEAST